MKLLEQLLKESTEFVRYDGRPLGVRIGGPRGTTKVRMEISKRQFGRLDPNPVYGDDGSEYDSPQEWLNAMEERGTEIVWMDRFQANRRASELGQTRKDLAHKGWGKEAQVAATQQQEWHRKARS